jgi:hypothetical protein
MNDYVLYKWINEVDNLFIYLFQIFVGLWVKFWAHFSIYEFVLVVWTHYNGPH